MNGQWSKLFTDYKILPLKTCRPTCKIVTHRSVEPDINRFAYISVSSED